MSKETQSAVLELPFMILLLRLLLLVAIFSFLPFFLYFHTHQHIILKIFILDSKKEEETIYFEDTTGNFKKYFLIARFAEV